MSSKLEPPFAAFRIGRHLASLGLTSFLFLASTLPSFSNTTPSSIEALCEVDLKALRRKQVHSLELEAERARDELLAAGGASNTTSLRTELKHQTQAQTGRNELKNLEDGLSKYPEHQRPLLRFRDKPRSDGKRTGTDTGSTETFSYRTRLNDEAITELTQGKYLSRSEDQALWERLKMQREQIIAGLKQKNPSLTTSQMEEGLVQFDEQLRADLVKRIASKQMNGKIVGSSEAERVVRKIFDARTETGKIRYRKYRTIDEGQDLSGVASPGSPRGSHGGEKAPDSIFKGKTMVEFKGKNSEGESVKSTVVNKPQVLVEDSIVPELHKADCFKSADCFQNFKQRVSKSSQRAYTEEEIIKYKKDIHTPAGEEALARRLAEGGFLKDTVDLKQEDAWKQVVEHLKSQGQLAPNDPAALAKLTDYLTNNPQGFAPKGFNPKQVEAMMDFFKSLHNQNISTLPVQRTLYTRDAYALEVPSTQGKPIEVQITFDRDIRELDLSTGETVGRFPYVDAKNKWNFQHDPKTGEYQHIVNGKIVHVYNPESKQVYEVKNGKVQDTPVPGTQVDHVEVVEVKVPAALARMGVDEIAKYPALADVKTLRDRLVQRSEDLNGIRRQEDLVPFKVDSGKSGANFRGTIWKPISVQHPRLGEVEFVYDFRNNIYAHWNKDGSLEYVLDMKTNNVYSLSDSGSLSLVPKKP